MGILATGALATSESLSSCWRGNMREKSAMGLDNGRKTRGLSSIRVEVLMTVGAAITKGDRVGVRDCLRTDFE